MAQRTIIIQGHLNGYCKVKYYGDKEPGIYLSKKTVRDLIGTTPIKGKRYEVDHMDFYRAIRSQVEKDYHSYKK